MGLAIRRGISSEFGLAWNTSSDITQPSSRMDCVVLFSDDCIYMHNAVSVTYRQSSPHAVCA